MLGGIYMRPIYKTCVLFFLCVCALSTRLSGAASLSPLPKILVILADDNQASGALTALAAMHLALDSLVPPQPFDVVVVKNATEPAGGITPALNRGIANSNTVTVATMTFTGVPITIAEYCQVWDLRFETGCSALTCSATIPAGDQIMYANFLRGGGSLFLNGENQGFEGRNNGLTQFLTTIGTGAAFTNPGSVGGTTIWNIFPADPLGFSTILNNLPGLGNTPQPTVPGWYDICGTCSGWGSSHPIAAVLNGGVTQAFMFAMLPNELIGGAGRVMVDFDFNGFWLFQQVLNAPVYQNIYTWLGNCQVRYNVSKVANVANITVGNTFNYTLCLQNTGAATLNQVIYDTLPPCVAFVSSVPAPTGNTGNYYWWNPGAIVTGTGTCVTITVQAASLACP